MTRTGVLQLVGLCYLCGVVLSLGWLGNGWTQDDAACVLNNRAVAGPAFEVYGRDLWGFQERRESEGAAVGMRGLWRPGAVITWWGERRLFGHDASLWHLITILEYGLCCALLCLVGLRLGGPTAAGVAAVSWAAMVCHVEACNVSNSSELMGCCVLLGGILLWDSARYKWLGLVVLGGAVTYKEDLVCAVVVAIVWDTWRAGGRLRAVRWDWIAWLLGVESLWLVLRALVMIGGSQVWIGWGGVPLWHRVVSLGVTDWLYIVMPLLYRSRFDYFPWFRGGGSVALGLLGWWLIGGIGLVCWRYRSSGWGLCAGWWLAALAVFWVGLASGCPGAEREVLPASCAVAWALGLMVERWAGDRRWGWLGWLWAVWVVGALVASCLQVSVWRSDAALGAWAVAQSPGDAYAYGVLGESEAQAGHMGACYADLSWSADLGVGQLSPGAIAKDRAMAEVCRRAAR